MNRKLRLVILGMMGRCPFGGQTWVYLNWLSGLKRLGHEVYYAEDDTVWPYDPEINAVTDDCSYAVDHIAHCMERIGLPGQWAFRMAGDKDACWGMTDGQLNELYGTCDILINLVGATELRDEHMNAPFRVYVQTDPVTSELKLAGGDERTRTNFSKHHRIVTYGENYGNPDCGVPLNGISYVKTRQPVDLDLWQMSYDPSARFFTTIGNYRQSGNDVYYKGETFHWSKHYEWEKYLDLPQRTTQEFELALKLDVPDDQQRLESHGWRIISPLSMSLDIFGSYPDYFRRSRAEFTVAKDQNIRLRSGWFSDRDACYLACGKPVVIQDTGFSSILPVGEGLFAFTGMDDILGAIDAVNSDYQKNCRSARVVAEEYFRAEKVLSKLLADIGF